MPANEGLGSLADAVSTLDRRSRFELLREVHLDFPTYHPQGMAFAKGLTFLSSVEILDPPEARRGPGLAQPRAGERPRVCPRGRR
ncbi:hypothetical protein [Arthrobacter sp. NA-172]|uniref:hypothetical protein n=1 Tax=Arthrobacter sp. NA-172 TaxID=3367524 RepID=UPI003754B431